METNVNNKCGAFTSLEQSKRLTEILPLESADMHYPDYDFDGNAEGPCNTPYKEAIEDLFHVYINPKTKRPLPCWSLAALLDVLPNYQMQTQDDGIGILCSCNGKFNIVTADNPIDACVDMIERLNELKML